MTLILLTSLLFPLSEQKNITAVPGQKVTLTCRAPDSNNILVKWSRADLGSEYVLLYRDDRFVPDDQHQSFKNRVDLQDRQMKDGDVSVILRNVTTADEGTYECRIIQKEKERDGFNLISIIYLRVVAPPPGDFFSGHVFILLFSKSDVFTRRRKTLKILHFLLPGGLLQCGCVRAPIFTHLQGSRARSV
uniref:Ig-like domain-containing protein n=1 Tax=Amphilophus citrinellus TaxID=61819 RepID=A0A3Q0RD35_AMPCI